MNRDKLLWIVLMVILALATVVVGIALFMAPDVGEVWLPYLLVGIGSVAIVFFFAGQYIIEVISILVEEAVDFYKDLRDDDDWDDGDEKAESKATTRDPNQTKT